MKLPLIVCLLSAFICAGFSVPLIAQFEPTGELDVPEYGETLSGNISVSGWALALSEPTLTIRVYVDGEEAGTAAYPIGERPDIAAAFPALPYALNSAFRFVLDTTQFANGEHQITVTAQDSTNPPVVIGETWVFFDQTYQPLARPWPDTTSGIYVFKDALPDSLTSGQLEFAAAHYAGCAGITRRMADDLRIINPDFLSLHDRPVTGLGYRLPDAQGEPLGNWVPVIEGNNLARQWPAAPVDDWFYAYGGSDRVYYKPGGYYLCDPDDAAWRGYWTGETGRQIRANDADGVLARNAIIPNLLDAGLYVPALPGSDPAFEADWSAKIESWLGYAKSTLNPAALLIADVADWVDQRNTTDYTAADGVFVNGFAEHSERSPFDLTQWQRQMDRILDVTGRDKVVILKAAAGDLNNRVHRMFLLANYLLIKGSKTFVNLEQSAMDWLPEYEADLGACTESIPTGIAVLYRDSWGVYARNYANGLALVNPTGETKTFTVPEGLSRVVPHGGGAVPEDGRTAEWRLTYEPVTTLTMPPYSGEVLTTDAPSPGFLMVSPDASITANGPLGGPFAGASAQYVLSNTGEQLLEWSAVMFNRSQWIATAPSSGTLSPHQEVIVAVSATEQANLLALGAYDDIVVFVNSTSGAGNSTRAVTLDVLEPGAIAVSPGGILSSSGPVGGPFDPPSLEYQVSNTGAFPVALSISRGQPDTWNTMYYMLSPFSSTTVGFAVNSLANALGPGTYSDTVSFTNMSTGAGDTSRTMQLIVKAGQLQVTPATPFTTSGSPGGPFSPTGTQYVLVNSGDAPINWTATHSPSATWLTLLPASGALQPGGQVTVTASINDNAKTLARGTYNDTISFTNTTGGAGNTTRTVRLDVLAGSLQVTPMAGLTASGPIGGPFSPASKQFALSNTGNASINFSAGKGPSATWIDINPASGTLAPGANAIVTVSINSTANNLAGGSYHENVTFTNATNGDGNTSRSIDLTVSARALSSVLVTPGSMGCPSPDPRQISASAIFTDGGTQDITNTATWSSSKPSVCTVSPTGVVTPVAKGKSTVTSTYTYGGVTRSGSCTVTVDYQSIAFMYISPSTYTFRSTDPKQFDCKARLGNLVWLTVTEQCIWSSSSPNVASVDEHGIVTPIANGMTTISTTYTYYGAPRIGRATVTVELR